MLRDAMEKPHRIKWVEAERELAIRGIFPTPRPNPNTGFFPPDDSHALPITDQLGWPQPFSEK